MHSSDASAGGAGGTGSKGEPAMAPAVALVVDLRGEDVASGAEIPCGAGGGAAFAMPASGRVFAAGGGVITGNR